MTEPEIIDNRSEPERDERRKIFASAVNSLWWVTLIRGVALVILGLYALFASIKTIEVLAQVVGAFIIIDGVLALVAAAMGETTSRGGTALRGAICLLIGVFVFANPLLVAWVTATVLLALVAVSAIFGGIMEIMAAIKVRHQIEGEAWLIAGGVLSILFGVLLISAPFWFGLLLVKVIGFFAIVAGISLVGAAFRLRNFGKHLSN